jgi:hypothetical protein
MDLMKDSQPLFFPYEEKAAYFVQLESKLHYRAFYLPEVCGLPLGLVWPTTIGYDDLLASVQCLKSDYHHFTQVLQVLQSQITPWSQAIAALDPTPFIIPRTPFLDMYDKGFPAIKIGEFPDLIVNPQAFSPLQDMLHGYIWHLTCDAVLAVGAIQAQKFLAKFVE